MAFVGSSCPKATRIVASLLSAVVLAPHAHAGTFSIAPVRIELSAKQRTQALTIKNEQETPVTVELHVQAWSQETGEDRLVDTRDVLTTPPVFVLPAKGEQIIRVALRRDVDANRELAYRLILQEVPEAAPQDFVGLRVALRLSLPIFVSAHAPTQDDVEWKAVRLADGKVRIEAQNHGSAHLQVAAFTVQSVSDETHVVHASSSKYLLAGSSATWTVSPTFDAGNTTALDLRGMSDRGEFTAEVSLGSLEK
jgi:fimbrial chaperone protein